jgi:hypothetical protein
MVDYESRDEQLSTVMSYLEDAVEMVGNAQEDDAADYVCAAVVACHMALQMLKGIEDSDTQEFINTAARR